MIAAGALFVNRGLRLSNIQFTLSTTGKFEAAPITSEVRTDTFPHWLDIAGRAAADAEEARLLAVGAEIDDHDTFRCALDDEFRTSMVAVAASAFAIDAFYTSVGQHAPHAKVKARTRDASIFETLKRAFPALGDQKRAEVRDRLRMIFRLRDQAVHPPADWAEPVRHPAFNLGMEPRFVIFRAENATNAHIYAWQMIWFCLHVPKSEFVELGEWCVQLRNAVGKPPPEPPAWAKPET